jgi:hypothetical protein
MVTPLAEGEETRRTQTRGPRLGVGRAASAFGRSEGSPHSPPANAGPVAAPDGHAGRRGLSLTWGQADLIGKTLTVGRAKTSNGTGRVIPINDELATILAAHRAWFVGEFDGPLPDHYLFPWGKPRPCDPSRHATDITWGWDELRNDARVRCRLHDLRHTFATRLAENGASESTMLALMGHMSRAMMERYSHIRMVAKREAVEALTMRKPETNSEAVPTKSTTVEGSATIQ